MEAWQAIGYTIVKGFQGNDYKQSKLVDAMYTIAFDHINGEIDGPQARVT